MVPAGQTPARQVREISYSNTLVGRTVRTTLSTRGHVQVSPRYRLSERPQIPVPYFRQKTAAQLPAGDAAGMCNAAAQFGKVCQQPCANSVQINFGHPS